MNICSSSRNFTCRGRGRRRRLWVRGVVWDIFRLHLCNIMIIIRAENRDNLFGTWVGACLLARINNRHVLPYVSFFDYIKLATRRVGGGFASLN